MDDLSMDGRIIKSLLVVCGDFSISGTCEWL